MDYFRQNNPRRLWIIRGPEVNTIELPLLCLSERDPVERCRFCSYLYYVWKLPLHEAICGVRARYIDRAAPPFMLRDPTEKQRRLIAELEKGPARFTDILRRRIYGNKGLGMALADLAVIGLVAKDSDNGYRLTEEGKKQALRERMVSAIDQLLDGSTYEQSERRVDRVFLAMEPSG